MTKTEKELKKEFTGFDDDLYQEFVCCVISCIFKFPFEKWNAENDLD